jgi:hypothetical protein
VKKHNISPKKTIGAMSRSIKHIVSLKIELVFEGIPPSTRCFKVEIGSVYSK